MLVRFAMIAIRENALGRSDLLHWTESTGYVSNERKLSNVSSPALARHLLQTTECHKIDYEELK